MARDGFLVSRSIFDHDVFRQKRKFSRLEAWVWMLAEAAWKPRKVDVAGQSITLARGQFCHSLRFIGVAWGWEKDAVARFMNRLKIETMVETATETGQMVVTICNYDEYQLTPSTDRDSTATANETAPRQHRDSTATNENKDNQVINKSEDNSLRSLSPEPDEFDRWYANFPNKVGKEAARKAWPKARKQASYEVLCGGLRRYLAKQDDRPWCNPSTWLNQGRWADEPSQAPPKPKGAELFFVRSDDIKNEREAREARANGGGDRRNVDGFPVLELEHKPRHG